MFTAPHSTPENDRSDTSATRAFVRTVLLLASLLAFGVIGWEHTFHSAVLGVAEEDGAAGHFEHVFRDALLAFPMAIVAVAAGLRLGRRFGPVVRAAIISAAFGLLIVPSVRLHEAIDGALLSGSGHGHHHEAESGLEASTGVLGWIQHGLRDAAVAELAAVPLMLFGLVLLERTTRDRKSVV